MQRRLPLLLAFVVLSAALLGGCTLSSGVFAGMSQQSSDTSLSASYASFDGSLSRSVSLKAGDEVSFRCEGGEGLRASVRQGDDEIFEIVDGGRFTVPQDGSYAFAMKGKAENGAFSLSWQVE